MEKTERGKSAVLEVPGYDSPAKSYSYLMHYTDKAQYPASQYTTYDKYVLTNDNTATWGDLEWGTLSSNSNDYIDFTEVYCEYTRK